MFLGPIKSGKAYLVAKGDQNQEKSCPKILVLSINQYVVKEMLYGHFKQKFLLNCSFRTETKG